MRRGILIALAVLAASIAARALHTQEVIDRIVARVDTGVILLSDVRALSRYQQLVDGKSESDAAILDRLVDQWIVRNEADTARFPHPSDEQVDRGVERLEKSFDSASEYQTRKKQSGLSDAEIRRMVDSQLYLSNYLDSRFRPSVQVDEKRIQDFYQQAIVPRAKARGQTPPTIDAARDYIREALVQEGINKQSEQWLTESRARLRVDKLLDAGKK